MSITFEEFQNEMNLDLDKVFTAEEAHDIFNKNTIACYRGKMSFNEQIPRTGKEIIDKLVYTSEWFDKAWDAAWKKEMGDED